MTRKILSQYNEQEQITASETDQLIIVTGNNELACMVKGAFSGEIEGFELFRLEKDTSDWSDLFYELRADSRLLNKPFRNTHCYYNFEEAIMIPAHKFSAASAEDYLSLIYGESNSHDIKSDPVGGAKMVNAYRIRKSIHETIGRHFLLYKPHHIYSKVADDLLSRKDLAEDFMFVQLYHAHMVLAVVKKGELQLIQTFHFNKQEDILYHLLNCSGQFDFDTNISHLEISGMFETGSVIHKQIQPLFGLISFDSTEPTGVFKHTTGYPPYYFTPYAKLAL
jgi:hypothetical protein